LGHARAGQDKHAEALAPFERAIALAPEIAEAHYSLGCSLWQLGRADEAFRHWQRASTLKRDDMNTEMNLAIALKVKGMVGQAITAFDRVLALAPDNPAAHMQRALALLLDGRWDEGWAEFEYRWQDPNFPSPRRDYGRPLWEGGPLDGRRILLHWEQGLGDTIQFIRFAHEVKSRGATVIAEVQPRLLRLLRCVAGVDELKASGEPLPAFDCHAPLMSLPRLLDVRPEAIPAPLGYLRAEPERVTFWRERLARLSRRRVGLCWQGRRRHPEDRFRSIPLGELGPLLACPNVSWLSLQQEGDAAVAGLDAANRVQSFGAEMDEERDAFIDTAAIVANLDLVITVDTAIAHLAAALGVPTWLLLHAGPDWRWLKAGERTPWYPTMRFFRQSKLGDWPPVVRAVAEALSSWPGVR
jgi:Flp pilus assembly protein TadD